MENDKPFFEFQDNKITENENLDSDLNRILDFYDLKHLIKYSINNLLENLEKNDIDEALGIVEKLNKLLIIASSK